MEEGGEVSSRAGTIRSLTRLATLVFVALFIAFAVLMLIRDWPQTDAALKHATLWWLGPAAVCAVSGMALMAARWRAAICAVGGQRADTHRVISAFFLGEEGKYIPGAVWAALGRSELARREGYERSIAYSSVVLSLIGCYLAAAFTAFGLAILALIGGSINMPWWPIALVVVVGMATLHPAVSSRIHGLASRVLRRELTIEIPSWSRCLRLTASYVPVWILIAAATTFVTRALVPNLPIARVALAAVVSWIIGFISPTPGGIGVREAVFVAVAGIAVGPATGAAILARVLFVLVDGTGAGVGWLVLRSTEPSKGLATGESLTTTGGTLN
jgi:glycosyltransferase 2 family protein